MAKRLVGKVAIVTGAGRGIGKAEAIALAQEGASVVVNDMGVTTDGRSCSTSPADEVVSEILNKGGQAIANYDSVASPEGADRIIKSAINSFGKLDILVNNAGILRPHMIFNMSDEDWDEVIKVHLYGHFYCTRNACKWFKQQKSGKIINTSSTTGLGAVGAVHYSAAKEGIIGFTRSVAVEMSRYNVTCNAIRPVASTRLTDLVTPKPDENQKRNKYKETFMSSAPNIDGYLPEDIAPLVVFLASDEAADISGRTFYICRTEVSLYSEPARIKTVFSDDGWTVDQLAYAVPMMMAD